MIMLKGGCKEKGGFRKGRENVDQNFHSNKYKENRKALWEVMALYGVNTRLLNTVKSFCNGSSASVRVSGDMRK